jgi:ribonuclease HI
MLESEAQEKEPSEARDNVPEIKRIWSRLPHDGGPTLTWLSSEGDMVVVSASDADNWKEPPRDWKPQPVQASASRNQDVARAPNFRMISESSVSPNSATRNVTAPDDSALRQQLQIPPDATIIYTDGACPSNGTAAGRAGIGIFFGPNNPKNISARLPGKHQTNQRAELFAIVKVLKTLCILVVQSKEYVILSDSSYAVKGITEWSDAWERAGWHTARGGHVVSSDLFILARKLVQRLRQMGNRIEFRHVPGHSGVWGNEMADRLAVEGAWKDEILYDDDWDSEYEDEDYDQMALDSNY